MSVDVVGGLTTAGVLIGVFILAYAAIRQKDLTEILGEIRDLIKGKAEDAKASMEIYK